MKYRSYYHREFNESENYPEESDDDLFDFDRPILDAIATIVACIFIIGLFNNVLACIVIICSKSLHTATNCYLFSLSMSDILVLITGTTQEMLNLYYPSQLSFGLTLCAFKNWAAEMSLNVSILTISAFTIERYLAICYPFNAKVNSPFSRAIKILIATWLLAALCALAPAFETKMDYEVFHDCYLDKNFLLYYLLVSSIIFFILPMILMTIMYIQIGIRLKKSKDWHEKNGRQNQSTNNKNTVNMFVIIVVIFFVCWTPFHVQRLMSSHIMLFFKDPNHSFDEVVLTFFSILKHASVISYQLSAVLDPVIYSIMSLKFRQALKDLLSGSSSRAQNVNTSFKTNNSRVSKNSNRY